jgi:hypothetical protein
MGGHRSITSFGVDVQPCGQSLCLGDEPYPVKGVNYFPFGPWDAWKLDNDFAAMRRGGVNTVLVMSGAFSDNLTLFLDRLQAHGLRTIMYGPTYSRHPAVLGYDMCWECHLGHAQQRSSMLPAWQDWLADRFIGNVASCFHGEAPSLPTDAELCDRNASAAVAVFHRFVLDYENARFRDRAHEIRQSDPHHLLTFRNGWGLGWFGKCAVPGTDLRTAARVVDAISPEGCFSVRTESPIRWPKSRRGVALTSRTVILGSRSCCLSTAQTLAAKRGPPRAGLVHRHMPDCSFSERKSST